MKKSPSKFDELNLTDEEIKDILVMRDHFWSEDTATRQLLLSKWRRLKFFWNNITNVWYDSVAHDWRIWPEQGMDNVSDQEFYDQRINVFRAYLESIFAALSVLVPPVRAYPDDAENSLDIETAKAGDKIAGLIYRHNQVELLWLHSLFVYGTEGLVCAYNYEKFNKSYGTYKIEEYEDTSTKHELTTCPLCNFEISDVIVPDIEEQLPQPEQLPEQGFGQEPEEGLEQELDPTLMDESAMGETGMMPGQEICPNCQQIITPQIETVTDITERLTSSKDEPKGRVCIEAYGGLNVKIPLYARTQDEVLYLFKCHETHYANAIEKYPKLYDKISKQSSGNQSGSFDSYEQWARLSTEYRGEYPINVVTEKDVWFKCAAYNVLEEDRAKHWKKKYPDGIKASFVNDLFACAKKEIMDEHWTLEYNPLADYLVIDPLGMLLTSVQEITNDLISLHKQTLEHGVGLTIVDPAFIDLNAYSQTEVVPGAMIPSKTISGNKSLKDGIVELKTANFNDGSLEFGNQVQSLGQLASGAMPALFGQMDSETASQDSMAKNQSMARLGTVWKTKCAWWRNVFSKAIPMYIGLIQDDERDVKREKDGSFVNIVIKKAELFGKIGKVELEANENLPMSWGQKKDVVMQLLLSPNPQIIQMLMQPENLPILREAIGLDNFFIPGADDVDKQWAEIQQLIQSAPLPNTDEMGMENPLIPMLPSVEIDILFDTHPIHFEICRKWAVSEVGQYYKYNHPEEYQNVLLHAKQHLDAMQQMPEENPEENGAPNQEKPKQLNNGDAPITGVTNENAVQ